ADGTLLQIDATSIHSNPSALVVGTIVLHKQMAIKGIGVENGINTGSSNICKVVLNNQIGKNAAGSVGINSTSFASVTNHTANAYISATIAFPLLNSKTVQQCGTVGIIGNHHMVGIVGRIIVLLHFSAEYSRINGPVSLGKTCLRSVKSTEDFYTVA